MNDIYETSDIYIAAYLLAQGALLDDVDRRNPRRMIFKLYKQQDGDTFERMVSKYCSGEQCSVVPSQLFSSLRHLKVQVFTSLPTRSYERSPLAMDR